MLMNLEETTKQIQDQCSQIHSTQNFFLLSHWVSFLSEIGIQHKHFHRKIQKHEYENP